MKKLIPFTLYILLFNPFGLLSPVYNFTGNLYKDYMLKHYSKTTKAIVIDERNYQKNRSLNTAFSYSYMLHVEGKKYKNDTLDSTLKVGDKIEVEYFKFNPSINKPLNQIK